MVKRVLLSTILSSIIITSGYSMVVSDPGNYARWGKYLKEFQKQMQELKNQTKGLLNIEKKLGISSSGTNLSLGAETKKQALLDYINKNVGPGNSEIKNSVTDVIDGCLQDLAGGLGLDFKLPQVELCGVNLTEKLYNAVLNAYKKQYSNKTTLKTDSNIKPPGKSGKKCEKKCVKKENSGVKEKVVKEGERESGFDYGGGSGVDNPDSNIIESGVYNGIGTLYNNTKQQSAVVAGTPYSPDQQQFSNSLFNKKYKQELIREIDLKKIDTNSKAAEDLNDEDLKEETSEEKHPVTQAIPIIIPQLERYKTKNSGEYLLSARDDGYVYSTQVIFGNGDEFTPQNSELKGKLKKFYRDYNKMVGSSVLKFKESKTPYNYAIMSQQITQSVLGAMSTIKPDSDGGRQTIEIELLKGILLELHLLNTQIYTYNMLNNRNNNRKFVRIDNKLESIDTNIELLLEQNKQYMKNLLNRVGG